MHALEATRILSAFCADTAYADLPQQVVEIAKQSLLDTLGCAVGTRAHDPDKAAVIDAVVRRIGTAAASATVICGQTQASAPFAALANGVLCHGIDFDDLHGEALTHTSCVVMPAALATAEETGRSGADFITSYVLGYEIATRVGMAVMPSHYDHWHSTATNGTFGAAVAAGRNYGFTREQYADALGFSGTQAAGLLAFLDFGDYTKHFNPGKAAFNGVLSAVMVQAGATAPPDMLENAKGYTQAYSRQPALRKLTRGLDGGAMAWEMQHNMLKPYPSLAASHTAMEATLKLVIDNDLQPQAIARIVNRTYGTVKSHFSNPSPDNVMAARLSVPYCIAVCAARRSGGLDAFTPDVIRDPAVRDMMRKVEIVADPELDALYPEKFPSRVEITMAGGQVYRAGLDYAKGSPGNPCTRADTDDKFRRLASPVLGDARVREIIDMTRRLEDVRDVRVLSRLLA